MSSHKLRLRSHSATTATAATSSSSNNNTDDRRPISSDFSGSKNVVVVGGSYGGMHAATVLAQRLPPSHRVILVERNSHFNHLYVFPRFSTLPGHEHKAFIPYSSIFSNAPKRPLRPRSSKAKMNASARGSSSHLDAENRARSKADGKEKPQQRSGEEMLGMGSLAGRAFQRRDRGEGGSEASSSSSSTSSWDVPSASSMPSPSSSSRSSSTDGWREDDSMLSVGASLSSASSAASSTGYDGARDVEAKRKRAGIDAGNRAVERAIAAEAQTGAPNEQAQLGRPSIQVEELGSALDKGIDLTGAEDAEGDEESSGMTAAEGFHEASPHLVLQATVSSITPSHVIVEQPTQSGSAAKNKHLWSIDSVSIPYTHLVYALGSHLPDPLRTEARTKAAGMSWMRDIQARVKAANQVVLVGGGALGVEFATDIKSLYTDKDVTLIHSRQQLLPNFDVKVHEIALARLQNLGVKVVLGERLALTEGCPRGSTVKAGQEGYEQQKQEEEPHLEPAVCLPGDAKGEGFQAHRQGVCVGGGRKLVKTTGGKEFECDLLLLCTGQQPNSALMAQLSPTSVDPATRLVRVLPTLQVEVPDGGLAQMPFEAKPPCGDCDCFLDKKAAGGDVDAQEEEDSNSSSSSSSSNKDLGCLSNVYAIGDVADAFGALNAGYQAWNMAEVAADNIVRDIGWLDQHSSREEGGKVTEAEEEAEKRAHHANLVHYKPAPNMLKLSLGLGKMVFQGAPSEHPDENGRHRPEVTLKEDPADLAVEGVWQFMANHSTDDMTL
ncbi:FAD/NAD(P)-binding domain-containing protein [Acaromyces ingoldii]|uniref:FAD/NAD(P)-binding domain-containing protein n=1 Tax=Acaromyces ingoldii TaxID=215250 RepID=A0A316YKZ1_9BASI|nr:FAD/NAD(P)-binding domain-containing protein [Acaromyces ingoldii]PWN89861.1 FAD/NAD(P)-binding domain-containing protein [Acaromyces ingoldii]